MFISSSLSLIGAIWNLTWPWPLMTLINLVLNVRFALPSSPGLFSPSLCPIGARWNLTCPWPWMALTNLVLNVCFIFPSRPSFLSPTLGPIGASWNLTWPLTYGYLTLAASEPLTNINWHSLGPRCIYPSSFVSVGPTISEKIDGQRDRRFPAL